MRNLENFDKIQYGKTRLESSRNLNRKNVVYCTFPRFRQPIDYNLIYSILVDHSRRASHWA